MGPLNIKPKYSSTISAAVGPILIRKLNACSGPPNRLAGCRTSAGRWIVKIAGPVNLRLQPALGKSYHLFLFIFKTTFTFLLPTFSSRRQLTLPLFPDLPSHLPLTSLSKKQDSKMAANEITNNTNMYE
jgi:hypothetical protein